MAFLRDITRVAMLSIFFVVLSFPSIVLSLTFFTKLQLPPLAMGPESLAFDPSGKGPYTGVADGRTLMYQGSNVGFQDYAFNSPNRSKAMCDGNTDPRKSPVCGRPLGLGFNLSGYLYIADAYIGLLAAGTNGRLAKLLATSAEKQSFVFPDGLDVDLKTEIVYFTDASSRYRLDQIHQAISTKDATGRLLKYDPNTKNVTVLLRRLSVAAGVAVSIDGSFILVTEYIANRIQKYWLKGIKAGTSEVLVNLTGSPDNIKRTALGEFWVAVTVKTTSSSGQTVVPFAIRINGFGKIMANVSLSAQYPNQTISEVHEYNGALYIGSLGTDFVGVYRL